MARTNRLKEAATKIGSVVGQADRKARSVLKAARVAREELAQLAKKAEDLARDLKQTSSRVKRALR